MATAPNVQESFTIGKLAAHAGVSVETVRYYERRGLIKQPRVGRGFRRYPPETAQRLGFIRRAKELGFTLNEIAELLLLRVNAKQSCGQVRIAAHAKVAEVEAKIADLQQMKSALERLASRCRGRGPRSECPILESLEDQGASMLDGLDQGA